jgi:hypothetical protein
MKKPASTHRPLAYKDEEFLDSDGARAVRILAEYLQPLEVFAASVQDTIVFSARLGWAPTVRF